MILNQLTLGELGITVVTFKRLVCIVNLHMIGQQPLVSKYFPTKMASTKMKGRCPLSVGYAFVVNHSHMIIEDLPATA